MDNPPGELSVKIRKFFRIKQKLRKLFSLMTEKFIVEVTVMVIVKLLISDPFCKGIDKDETHLLYCESSNMFEKTNEEASASF